MSNKGDIHAEVLNRLRNNPTLSGYVRKIYDFDRDVVLSSDMPAICIHNFGSDEIYADFPKRKQDIYKARIRGILYAKDRIDADQDLMFQDGDYIGLYKFEADIKNAIENNSSGTSDDLSINLTGYYPKFRTSEYRNLGQNVSIEVSIDLEIEGRYFFAGQR